jgi:hypothetical protein
MHVPGLVRCPEVGEMTKPQYRMTKE